MQLDAPGVQQSGQPIGCRLAEAWILIEAWRRHYNTVRPHSSLGYRPPAGKTWVNALCQSPNWVVPE
jgi:transposase InsO family protein